MRHTHATLLLQAGVNPKIVSERLGHHSIAFTLDTYAHVLPGMQAEAAQDFSDLVFGIAVDEHLATAAQQPEDDAARTRPTTRTTATATLRRRWHEPRCPVTHS